MTSIGSSSTVVEGVLYSGMGRKERFFTACEELWPRRRRRAGKEGVAVGARKESCRGGTTKKSRTHGLWFWGQRPNMRCGRKKRNCVWSFSSRIANVGILSVNFQIFEN